jgi:hypothetical protein
MQLQNTTLVILSRTPNGGLAVARVRANPEVAEKDGGRCSGGMPGG